MERVSGGGRFSLGAFVSHGTSAFTLPRGEGSIIKLVCLPIGSKVPWTVIPKRGIAKRRTKVRTVVPVVVAATVVPARRGEARELP